MSSLAELRLKKNEDRRLRSGHLWVYSNEVDIKQTPLKNFAPGEWCNVTNHQGRVIGTAYVNPNTLICARLVNHYANQILNHSALSKRLQQALHLREQIFAKPYYRLVFGESDALPGLVVDRYGEILVVQISTAGMEQQRETIIAALQDVVKPAAIVLRNDSGAREAEGLPAYVETVLGTLPELVELEENQTRFRVSVSKGQKTGWFYDHRLNRARMQQYVKSKRVLDIFSYVGGWGVQALIAGASQVTCVDSSATALELAIQNAELNGHADKFATLQSDGFEALAALRDAGEMFDVVILDPPAFIKRRKDHKEGSLAYRRLNRLALSVLAKDGFLVSASCSYHLEHVQLLNEIRQAANLAHTNLQIVEQGHQGPDHPIHPAMKETEYLKAFICHAM